MSAPDSPFSDLFPKLLRTHYEQLHQGSGIGDDIIAERRYFSVFGPAELASLGFGSISKQQAMGLVLPVWGPDGSNSLYVHRPDSPSVDPKGRPRKYLLPPGASTRLDCPPRCRAGLGNPSIDLWIVEVQKKADAGASRGLCIVALLGVWNFKGKNGLGGTTWLADWDYIALNERAVYIAYDSDVMEKSSVRAACGRLAEHLRRKHAKVTIVYLPVGDGQQKIGLDDYLLTHTTEDLRALAVATPAAPTANRPTIELLDAGPATLRRPLGLVDGRAYAVTWLWVKTTTTEYQNDKGQIERLAKPRVQTIHSKTVIRDDGATFGDHADQPLDALGVRVLLPSQPREGKLWRAAGVTAYRGKQRVNGTWVFRQLVALVDHFVDFERSLADQETMCELVACYILTTWFLDAFTCIGFLWPSGGYGCGKTKLGMLICEVAYLGEAVLSGSTYAAMRDLADMGGTILLDDVEALTDPRKTDPDKRNLLLAGNRKGSVIAVKELTENKQWVTRYVDAYCPRLFTATRLPDPILASRTIVVPLVRTANAAKGNREVLDYKQWPHDRGALVDDLWALALANLSGMAAHEDAVNREAPLVGRALEPWRPVLAVAHFLAHAATVQHDPHLTGLYRRMTAMATSYQTERTTLEGPDLVRLVVRALLDVAVSSVVPLVPFSRWGTERLEITVDAIVQRVNTLAVEEELATQGEGAYTTGKRVGWVLSRQLRLPKAPREHGKGRARAATLLEIDRLAQSYGLSGLPRAETVVAEQTVPPPQNGTNGTTEETVPDEAWEEVRV